MEMIVSRRSLIFSCLALSIAFILACNSMEKSNKEESAIEQGESVTHKGTASEEQRQFFYAWMADCINDNYEDYLSDSTALADSAFQRINGAINNPTVVKAFGSSELVWGSQLVLQGKDEYYASANLMYCVKRNFRAEISEENKLEGKDILEKFLTNAAGFVKTQPAGDCHCAN